MKGIVASVIGIIIAGCSSNDDIYNANYKAEQFASSFEKNIGKINPNQNWNLFSSRTVAFDVNGESDKDYTLSVCAGDPATSKKAVVYNEGGLFADGNINSSPGSQPSFIYNFADMHVSESFEQNSTSHFYNEGSVYINGNSSVTMSNCWWINKGHYTVSERACSSQQRGIACRRITA